MRTWSWRRRRRTGRRTTPERLAFWVGVASITDLDGVDTYRALCRLLPGPSQPERSWVDLDKALDRADQGVTTSSASLNPGQPLSSAAVARQGDAQRQQAQPRPVPPRSG